MEAWKLSSIWNYFVFLCFGSVALIWVLVTLPGAKNDHHDNSSLVPQNGSNQPFQLLDLNDFHFLIRGNICSREDGPFLVIIIHSAPDHFELRNYIRNGYARPKGVKDKLHVAFLLAASQDPHVQQHVIAESNEYGDIVQGSFIDAYRNLTYKHVMGLSWVVHHCPKAKLVLKMDDDIFVNIYQLLEFLKRYSSLIKALDTTKSMACYVQEGMKVERNILNKWHVSKEEYPNDVYENYCSGWAYLLSVKTAQALVSESKHHPLFWVDDVFVTGILANALHVYRHRLNQFYTIDNQDLQEWTESKNIPLLWRYIFGPVWGDKTLMLKGHQKATWCHRVNCTCCFRRRPVKVWKPVNVQGSVQRISIQGN